MTHTNPTPPTTTKQSDKAATTERQPYPTPAFSDVGNTQSSTSAPPSVGASAVNNREHVGERIGERPWEYRPVGTQRRDPSRLPQMLMKISFSQTGLGTVDKPMLQSSTISTNIPLTMPPLQQILYQKNHLHRDRLPKEPKNWKQMLKHPHMTQSTQVACREFEHLQSRGTFKLASRTDANSEILPLVWVFKY